MKIVWHRRATCAIVVLCCIELGCTPASQQAGPPDRGTSTPVATSTAGGADVKVEWETLDASPLEGRKVSPVARVGDELLFFGPRTMLQVPLAESDGGVAFNVSMRTWRSIARGGPANVSAAVWTGDVVFVLALDTDQSKSPRAFVYRPTLDRWDRIASPPRTPTAISAELYWTGSEVLAPQFLSAWDPATGAWRSIHATPNELSGSSYKTVAIDGGVLFDAGNGPSFAFNYRGERQAWSRVNVDVPLLAATSYRGGAAGVNERNEVGTARFSA